MAIKMAEGTLPSMRRFEHRFILDIARSIFKTKYRVHWRRILFTLIISAS